MMDGVSGVQSGFNPLPTGQTTTALRPGFQPLRATGGSDSFGLGATSGTGQSDQIQTLLTDIFKALGSSLDNDQSMRMLMVLLMLVALLQGVQNNTSDTTQSLDRLNTPSGQQAYFASSYSETTTILIQYSSTTTLIGGSGTTGDASNGTGGLIDVAI